MPRFGSELQFEPEPACSVEQGFQKPQGYRGKGLEGRYLFTIYNA